MPNQQPSITSVDGRQFAASSAAVLSFIVDPEGRVLMLAHPQHAGRWEPVNGALDAGETVLTAVQREVQEEAGPEIQVRPLGAFHVYTFRYDDNVQYMICICYLLAYEGGPVVPGDDMAGSEAGWFHPAQIEGGEIEVIVPSVQTWLFRRAVDVYHLLKDQPAVTLQPHFDETTRHKYNRE